MTAGQAITIRNLSHSFGAGEKRLLVLDNVSMQVGAGEFVSLVGPSGCGKSTVLRMLAGLLVPTQGEVLVGGESTAGQPGNVAFMPQKDLLLPWRRALDNAVLGATIAGESKRKARERALEFFERFGLAGFEGSWPTQLSGGMRQRLALLRTFLMPNGVLLLDEPFGALDAITRREMYIWLEEVWRRDGRTVLFVTHDVDEALLLSHRVHVMSRRPGRIVDTVEVPFPRPRTADVLGGAELAALKRRILEGLGVGSPGPGGVTLGA